MKTPKFKNGDKIVILPRDEYFYHKRGGLLIYYASFLSDDEMGIISSEAKWYPYANHPNGGYHVYEVQGFANCIPEDFMALFVEDAEYYLMPQL